MPNPERILINGGDTVPYHVFIYMLMIFMFDDISQPIYYYYPKSESKFIEELLPLLPSTFIRDLEKVPGRNYKIYDGPRLFFNDWAFVDIYNFIRRLFEPHLFKEIKPKLYVYISRNYDAKSRHVINEVELQNALTPLGFKTICFSNLSVEKQLKLFSCADIIITPHGSALTYSIFCNKDVTIIELLPIAPYLTGHYRHISCCYNYDYYHIKCHRDEKTDNITVDVPRVKRFLEAHPKFNA
jgi:hypothetical protein